MILALYLFFGAIGWLLADFTGVAVVWIGLSLVLFGFLLEGLEHWARGDYD
jgi:hypothetical protein